ncbi:MAG: B12-binding domain-containing radical SAM protein, partial [bacterium]|nr:B12-binding domain-containing radical SAM protein [bacterium]
MKDKPISSITSRLVQITSPDHYTPWNALSLEALAGHVRGCFGARADVHISRVRSEEDIPLLLDAIKVNPPDILGISPELSSLKWTEMILQRFHKLDFSPASAPLVVLGNKLPSYFPQYYLKQFPGVIVVIGEGEESFAGLIRYAAGERTLESIPNLVYFDNQGNLKYTQQQTPDLSLLPYPPALDTVDEIAENDWNALVQSSRGCSWSSCSYCTISSFRKGKKWDGFPVERVAQNIKQLVAAGITQLEFADDDFIGGRDDTHLNRIEKIADEIEAISKSSGKNIDFRIFVIPHIIYRKNQDDVNEKVKQLLLRLKEVGLSKVYFGVEAGCPSQLKRYNRSYNLHELDAVIHLFREQLEMEIDVGFIMFDPHLTLKEMKQNIEYFIDKKLI